jgi:hypothetical protein
VENGAATGGTGDAGTQRGTQVNSVGGAWRSASGRSGQ